MSRWKVPEHFKVMIGGNTYIDCPTIISYKKTCLFELCRSSTDGFLGINFDIYAKDGTKIATVRNGQFVGATPAGFEVLRTSDHYVMTESAVNRRVCEIRLRHMAGGDAELEVSAQMYMPDGTLASFDANETKIGTLSITGCVFRACGAAIRID